MKTENIPLYEPRSAIILKYQYTLLRLIEKERKENNFIPDELDRLELLIRSSESMVELTGIERTLKQPYENWGAF